MAIKKLFLKSLVVSVITASWLIGASAAQDPFYKERLQWIDKKVTTAMREWFACNKIRWHQKTTVIQTVNMFIFHEHCFAFYRSEANRQWKAWQKHLGEQSLATRVNDTQKLTAQSKHKN